MTFFNKLDMPLDYTSFFFIPVLTIKFRNRKRYLLSITTTIFYCFVLLSPSAMVIVSIFVSFELYLQDTELALASFYTLSLNSSIQL